MFRRLTPVVVVMACVMAIAFVRRPYGAGTVASSRGAGAVRDPGPVACTRSPCWPPLVPIVAIIRRIVDALHLAADRRPCVAGSAGR